MTKVGNAFRYPFTADRWSRVLLLGGLCVAAAPLVVPWLLVAGYWRRVLTGTVSGSPKAPSLSPLRSLLVDGLVTSLVAAVYLLGPVALGLTIVAITGGAGALAGDVEAMLVGGVAGAVLGALVAATLLVPGSYVLGAVLGNVGRTGRLRSAFALGEVRRIALHHSYVRGVGSAVILVVLGLVVATAVGGVVSALALFLAAVLPFHFSVVPLGILLLGGTLVGGTVAFFLGTAAVRAIGLGVVDATPPDVDWE